MPCWHERPHRRQRGERCGTHGAMAQSRGVGEVPHRVAVRGERNAGWRDLGPQLTRELAREELVVRVEEGEKVAVRLA